MNRELESDGHMLEIREERIPQRVRWSVRAAQWRALELARSVFGDRVGTRLGDLPPRGAFSGLVHLRVPFRDLDDHREREARFVRLAGRDEVLGQVPLVFAFEPDPEAAPEPRRIRGAR